MNGGGWNMVVVEWCANTNGIFISQIIMKQAEESRATYGDEKERELQSS